MSSGLELRQGPGQARMRRHRMEEKKRPEIERLPMLVPTALEESEGLEQPGLPEQPTPPALMVLLEWLVRWEEEEEETTKEPIPDLVLARSQGPRMTRIWRTLLGWGLQSPTLSNSSQP